MPAALLLMDFQAGVVERFGSTEVVQRARDGAGRRAQRGVPVVFVRVAFRDGAPEVSARNKSFSALAGQTGMGRTTRPPRW